MTKHVTLFGREMRKIREQNRSHPSELFRYELDGFYLDFFYGCGWVGVTTLLPDDDQHTNDYKSPHAAARALERKIVAAHRRLGKLIGTSQANDRGSRNGKP